MTPLSGGDAVEHSSLYQTNLPWLVHCVLTVMWSKFFRYLAVLLTPWRYSSCRALAASLILCDVSWQQIFYRVRSSAPHPTPTRRTRVSLLVWHLPRNLSGMVGPTSSYAAAGIALEFFGARKPPHQQQSACDKGEIPSRGPSGLIFGYFRMVTPSHPLRKARAHVGLSSQWWW
jgi:hypothetical protein